MLKVTIPFTNEIVFNPDDHIGRQLDELIINRFDEVRGEIGLSIKSFKVDEIAVYLISLKCPESVLIRVTVSNYAWIMNFVLNGQLNIKSVHGSELFITEKTHYSLIPAVDLQQDIVIKGEVNLFVVCLGEGSVKKLLSAEEEAVLQKRLSHGLNRVTTTAMSGIITSILRCIENNCLHKLLLAAKMLELLFLDLEQLNKASELVGIPAVRSTDMKKLEQAKNLIAQNIQAPCSLIELAHKVGLNDFKLKKGFREAFGTTVFGHLFDLRMEKAKGMLSTSNFTVSEVAHEVGYKNAHHFTVAFKKKFGYLPSKAVDNT